MPTYNVDIVLCVDVTGSMSSILEHVKQAALTFHVDLGSHMARMRKPLERIQCRVIAFRDFYCDSEPLIAMPDFVDLRADATKFEAFIRELKPQGGGDEPENSLEALALAMQSPWDFGSKGRQIIVLWTDASAHPLEKARGLPSPPTRYPPNMPANLQELTEVWAGLPHNSKRLLLYAPEYTNPTTKTEAYPWNLISSEWEQSIWFPSKAGKGLSEFEFVDILNAIANSV